MARTRTSLNILDDYCKDYEKNIGIPCTRREALDCILAELDDKRVATWPETSPK